MDASTHPDVVTAAFSGPGIVIADRDFTGAPGTDDVLKFSAAQALLRGRVTAAGGAENACDVNNDSDIVLQGELGLTGGDQAGLSVKGGSALGTLDAGVVVFLPSAKSRTDLLVDDWSDRSRAPSIVVMRARRTDGQPVRVVFGRWHRPRIDGPSRIVWGWTIALHLYNPAKALLRALLRIPAGTKGPAWF
jgi:hypothetical protein